MKDVREELIELVEELGAKFYDETHFKDEDGLPYGSVAVKFDDGYIISTRNVSEMIGWIMCWKYEVIGKRHEKELDSMDMER